MNKTEAYKEVQKWKNGFKAPSDYNKEIISALTAANYVRLLRGQKPVNRLAVIPKWNWNNNGDPIKETIEGVGGKKEIYRKWRNRHISIHVNQDGYLIMQVNENVWIWDERIPSSKTAAKFLMEWKNGNYSQFGEANTLSTKVNNPVATSDDTAVINKKVNKPAKSIFPDVNF